MSLRYYVLGKSYRVWRLRIDTQSHHARVNTTVMNWLTVKFSAAISDDNFVGTIGIFVVICSGLETRMRVVCIGNGRVLVTSRVILSSCVSGVLPLPVMR